MCVCRFPKAFIETPDLHVPYFMCCTTFTGIMNVKVPFIPTTPLGKLILFDIPIFTGSIWSQLRNVQMSNILTFLQDYPQYFLPNMSPPSFFLIPLSMALISRICQGAPHCALHRRLFSDAPTTGTPTATAIPPFTFEESPTYDDHFTPEASMASAALTTTTTNASYPPLTLTTQRAGLFSFVICSSSHQSCVPNKC